MSALEKAMLVVVDGKGIPPVLAFQYNPEQFTIQKSAEWKRYPSAGHESTPPPDYTSTNPTSVSMEIFFDASEESSEGVSLDVGILLLWTRPTPISRLLKKPLPPVLMFQWGVSTALATFQGYLKSVSARYTMFRADGTPIRATCSITLEEVPLTVPFQNPTSGSRPGMRVHVVTEGETLHSVAWQEYRMARYWRGLAAFNDIDDPLRVPAGTTLLLPLPRDAASMS